LLFFKRRTRHLRNLVITNHLMKNKENRNINNDVGIKAEKNKWCVFICGTNELLSTVKFNFIITDKLWIFNEINFTGYKTR
jgi:hypothetical protein